MSESKVLAPGFSRATVEELSRLKGEPNWLLQLRLHAWETYENTPASLGRRGDLGTHRTVANFKFQNLNPFTLSSTALPSTIEQSLKSALVNERSGLLVQLNSSVVRCELREDLKQQGVILTDLDTAVHEYPELIQKYFMTECVPAATSKYTALHAAFWTGGFFLYVPQDIEIEEPILAQVWSGVPTTATSSRPGKSVSTRSTSAG